MIEKLRQYAPESFVVNDSRLSDFLRGKRIGVKAGIEATLQALADHVVMKEDLLTEDEIYKILTRKDKAFYDSCQDNHCYGGIWAVMSGLSTALHTAQQSKIRGEG